jgi:hypothetical protein
MKFLMSIRAACTIALFAAYLLNTTTFAQDAHTTDPFHGVKVNGGTVVHSKQNGRNILTLSGDFKVPDIPDLPLASCRFERQRLYARALASQEREVNKSITLPGYVPDVAKVQIWCAFAETLLGEASFSSPVM